MQIYSQEKIGLVLGGGAARGLAHIGVLKAIEEFHIPVDVVGGTSMGAIIGGLWSSGFTAAEIESIFLSSEMMNWFTETSIKEKLPIYYSINSYQTLIDLNVENNKLIMPEGTFDDKIINFGLYAFFAEIDNAINGDFRKLWKPFLCTATDINMDRPMIIVKGRLENSIRASMSLPVIFKPAKINGRALFDGGMVDNIPAHAVKDSLGADFIISVDVANNRRTSEKRHFNLMDVTFTLIDLLTANTSKDTLEPMGYYVRPEVGNYNGYEFNKVQELIDLGYKAMKEAAPKILEKLKRTEDYPSYRKDLIDNFIVFEGRIIGEIEIKTQNALTKNTILNAIEMKPGSIFSYDKLRTGFYRLYAMGIFSSITPEITYDKNNKTLKIIINAEAINYNIISIGAFTDSKAGINIYAKYEKNNIFNYGGMFNVYGFAGNFIKGASLNLFFPSLGHTNTIAGIYSNYHIYKYFGVWTNTFDYHYNFHTTILFGNNYGAKSVFSLFWGSRYKKIAEDDLLKTSFGLYYVENTLNSVGENKSGIRRSFMLGINVPVHSFVFNEISTYSDIFSLNNFQQSYFKGTGNFLNSIKVYDKLNVSLFSSAGLITQMYKNQIFNTGVSVDYPMMRPTFEFKYLFDRALTGRYFVSAGMSERFYVNDNIFIRNETEAYAFMNQMKNDFSPSFIAGTRLSLGISTILGLFEMGGGYFKSRTDTLDRSFFTYSIYLGNPIEKFDILDTY